MTDERETAVRYDSQNGSETPGGKGDVLVDPIRNEVGMFGSVRQDGANSDQNSHQGYAEDTEHGEREIW